MGDGGLAIQTDFKNLVQRNPKSSWNNSTSPGATNDSTQDFYPGSLWSTPTQLFLCTDSTPSHAVWVPILISSSAANGTLLIGNGTGFALSTLTGSVNQVTVSNGPGTITPACRRGSRRPACRSSPEDLIEAGISSENRTPPDMISTDQFALPSTAVEFRMGFDCVRNR